MLHPLRLDFSKVCVVRIVCIVCVVRPQVPRTIEVEMQGPLVHSCVVGDVVTITGLVKVGQTY